MREIPKIVRERLKAGPVSLTHPDADVLTAFSERSLPERERATVLEHLSGCADCREILAFALPPSESVQALSKAHSSNWLSWPVFRRGFAFAGLVAVAVFGFVQYWRHSQQTMTYYKAPASASLQAKTEPLPQSRAEDKVGTQQESRREELDRDAPKSKVAADSMVPPPASSPSDKQSFVGSVSARSRKALPHGPLQLNQWQQQNALTNQAANAVPAAANTLAGKSANAAPAPSPQMVTVESAAPAIDTKAQDLGGLVLKNQSVADLQPQGGHAEAEVEKIKQPPLGAGPRKIVAQTDQLAVYQYAAGLPANTPRWSISSTGTLQRSFDQGVTWQNVNVTNSPAAGGAAFAMAAAPARAKEAAENESLKKAKKDELPPPVFRTVAANGLDVWAGGANGLLYHSTDAGAHWVRVVPSVAGAVLTGDVLTMEFPDPHQGKIVTSTGESWSTTDGGVSWQKQ